MKIALIGNDYVQQFPVTSYGGIESYVERVAATLHKNDYDFIVIIPKRKVIKNFPFDKRIRETLSPSSSEGGNIDNFISQAASIVYSYEPDIIWSQSNWSADGLYDLNVPIICTFHDSCSKQDGWIKPYKNVRYRFLSKFQYNNWVKESWENEKSFQCHFGMLDEDYKLYDEPKNDFLWVAGMQWGITAKGLDIFIELAKSNPDLKFVAYGNSHDSVKDFLQENLNKYKNFTYGGILNRGEEHSKAFGLARAFIAPTQIPDTFPTTVLEAMTKGTPVLGSANGAIPEMIGADGGFSSNDFEELNKALRLTFDRNRIFEYSKKFHIDNEIKKLIKESENLIK